MQEKERMKQKNFLDIIFYLLELPKRIIKRIHKMLSKLKFFQIKFARYRISESKNKNLTVNLPLK